MAVPFKQYCHQLIRAKNSGGLGLFWETLQILSLTPLNFPAKKSLGNERRNSMQMTCLGSASDWLKQIVCSRNDQSEQFPDLGRDTSSEWNFCTRFSDVMSFRGETSEGWRWEISAVFCSIETVIIPAIICLCLPTLPLKDSGTNYIFVFHIISIDNQSI